MDELLKALDESVFTPELTQKIQDLYESKINQIEADYSAKLDEAVQTAVGTAVQTAVEVAVIEAKAEVEAKAQEEIILVKEEMTTKATEYAEYVKEEIEAKVTEYTEYVKEELSKTMSAYLDSVVGEYVEENKIAIDESVQSAKMKAVLEGFDSLLVTTGVSISQIAEAKSEISNETEIAQLKESVNKLAKENIGLKTSINEMTKNAVVTSVSAEMNLVQKDKFDKLSEMVVYTGNLDEYTAKLKTLAETITQKAVEKPLDESVPAPKTSNTDAYKRFI